MNLVEQLLVHNPPIVLRTPLPRAYQCLSNMELMVKAQGKSTTNNPLGWKGAESFQLFQVI